MTALSTSCDVALRALRSPLLVATVLCSSVLCSSVLTQSDPKRPDFAELKRVGAAESRYRQADPAAATESPGTEVPSSEPDLAGFRATIAPILANNCYRCHGPEEDEGGLRLDELDADLFAGDDVDWWVDVLAVLNNGEMPPPDDPDSKLSDADRSKVVDWLANETHRASRARRATNEHTSFRRLTRYEYRYALQDLLELPFEFGADLPPDPISEDGFRNSSELLHLTQSQLRAYLDAGRAALELATVTGERPTTLYWSVAMRDLAEREWSKQDQQLEKLREKFASEPDKAAAKIAEQQKKHQGRPGGPHFFDPESGRRAGQTWNYGGARYARKPTESPRDWSEPNRQVAIIPPGKSLIVELGDRVPEAGPLRVRFRAARESASGRAPRVRLIFGWQASNDSRSLMTVSGADRIIEAAPDAPQIYEFEVPLSQIYPRNLVRGVQKLGDLPSPSEFIRIAHAGKGGGPVQIDHVEVAAPAYESWPPASHTRLLPARAADESAQAWTRRVLTEFMTRAWRRPVDADEVDRKLRLLETIHGPVEATDGSTAELEGPLLEVMAAVLASPNFLFVVTEQRAEAAAARKLNDHELAARLALFLQCGLPDDELRHLADSGRLSEPSVLRSQVARLLASPQADRFVTQFVHQWLDLDLLEYLDVDRKRYPQFDPALRRSMLAEPIEFFREILSQDLSVLEFLHADFAMLDERLARHYGTGGVVGDRFRRVDLEDGSRRGGLLAQAGLLAMNSDGIDSHPLKRGIWLLERLLDDPPPPPPPAVPEIDLADPEIAKMTLKERLLDHRNHAACMSCHAKIDPWGFTFENFDAVGAWRDELRGAPVDAVGVLPDGSALDGLDGLKTYLIRHRQDQFVRAMVRKLSSYALGRPLGFGDRAAIDAITERARRSGDGLATIVTLIVESELFGSR